MPIKYINGSGAVQSDGYGSWAIGNNAAAGTSPDTAWETLANINTMTNGDTLIIFGTAAAPVTYQTSVISTLSSKALTITPTEDYGVIFAATSPASTKCIEWGALATYNIGAIIIDGTNTCVYASYAGSAGTTVNFIGTKFINWTQYGCHSQINTTLSGDWVSETTTSLSNSDVAGVRFNGRGSNTIGITDGTVRITSNAATGTVRGLHLKPLDATGGVVINATGTNISITTTVSAVVVAQWVVGSITTGQNPATTSMTNITSASTGVATNVSGGAIQCLQASSVNTTSATLTGCVASHSGSTPTSGIAFLIGNDNNGITAGTVPITVTDYTGNSGTNFSHGIMLGGVSAALASKNIATGSSQSLICKNTLNCQQFSSKIINPRGTALRFKGATTSDLHNNSIYISQDLSTYGGEGLLSIDDDASTVSLNNTFKNNNIYFATGGRIRTIVYSDVAIGTRATWANNNYYSEEGSIDSVCTGGTGAAFSYIAAATGNYAAWDAGTETTSLNVDPVFWTPKTQMRPKDTSTLQGAGAAGSATGKRDFFDSPFGDPPTVGYAEASSFAGGSGSSGYSSAILGKGILG